MKSEHRHELQTNYLSAGLARWIEQIKPFTGQIVTGAVLFVLVYAGLSLWNAQAAQTERAAWDAYALAADTGDRELNSLQRVAGDEQYAGTKMQEWAFVRWADRQVLLAMGSYLADRERTQERLRNAEGIYKEFANSARDPQVLNRARFGLARVYELQNKLDEARERYLTVRGELQLLASTRAEQLNSEQVLEATDWLATTELPERDLTGGQGATGSRPGFDATLPIAQPLTDGISKESLDKLLGDLTSDSSEQGSTSEESANETEGSSAKDANEDTNEDGTTAQ